MAILLSVSYLLIITIPVTVPIALVTRKLAKEKGRKIRLWTVLGLIPVFNLYFLAFCVGAANLRLEEKLDKLLSD